MLTTSVGYFVLSFIHALSSMVRRYVMTWEGLIELLSRHLHRGTEKTKENLRIAGRDANWALRIQVCSVTATLTRSLWVFLIHTSDYRFIGLRNVLLSLLCREKGWVCGISVSLALATEPGDGFSWHLVWLSFDCIPAVRGRDVRAVYQAVSRLRRVLEARLRSVASQYTICGGQSGTGTGFTPSTTVPPVTIFPPMLHTHLYITDNVSFMKSQFVVTNRYAVVQ
jgi:hypothetical protein